MSVQLPPFSDPFMDGNGVMTFTWRRFFDDLTSAMGGLTGLTTNDVAEGLNLYFTQARARSAISASGNLSYNSVSGVMSYTTPSNSATASKWLTARTLSFTGNVTGSGSVDGSADVATSLTISNDVVTPSMLTTGGPSWDASGNVTVTTLKVGSSQVVGSRKTGWTAATGTHNRGAYASYAGQTVSAGYVQAEVQAIDDALKALSRRFYSLETDVTSHGLIGA